MQSIKTIIFLPLLMLLLSSCSEEIKQSNIVVTDIWSRPTGSHSQKHRDMAETGVVYLTIDNHTSNADKLILAGTEISKSAEIHETKMLDGKMGMRHLPDGVTIPAQSTVKFEPHGKHIMLLGLKRVLAVNDSFNIELIFEKFGKVTVTSHVRF